MLRKIERDERRPSRQLAELLADHLAIDVNQRDSFLKLARGKYVQDFEYSTSRHDNLIPFVAGAADPEERKPPFVARARQLLRLHDHLEQAMQGQGKMVFIAGEAGRGKTCLLSEFARLAMDARPDLILAGGSSDDYTGHGDPLLPFRDIFHTLAGDIENASMQEIINRKLSKRVVRAIPVITETLLDYGSHLIDTLIPGGTLEAYLAQNTLHSPKNAELLIRLQRQRARKATFAAQDIRQERLFEEIANTLNALAQRYPLLLLLDDLHWIDQSSAALLGYLGKRMKKSPILIIGSYRPEDLAQKRPATAQVGQAQHPLRDVLSESLQRFGNNRIDLDHYEPGEDLEFINALLDVTDNDFSEEFRERLTSLTEGHPLFLVELLREMKEQGDIIQGEDGRWRDNETLSWENIPARVEGVIEKRIDRLPDDLLGLLTTGCVQGDTFFAEVIALVRGNDPRELIRRLSADLDRQHRLVYEQGVKYSGGGRLSQYRFRHHLFQIYLYGRLSTAERMYLHEAVGNALETLFPDIASSVDVPAAQLARHFQEARLMVKASGYRFLAGKQAARVFAFDEAAVHFNSGLSGLEDLPRTSEINHLEYDLRLARARALWHSGRVIEAMTAYEQSVVFARTLDDPNALANAVLAYEEPRWRLGLNSELSQQFLREALAGISEEQKGMQARLLVGLSRSLLAFGEQEELGVTVDQALDLARQIEDPLALCDALRIKAQIDRRPEMTAARLAAIQEMIATAESIGDQEMLADGLDLYVYDLLELGQIDIADQLIRTQKQIATEIKQPFQMHIAAVFQTMRAIMRGEFNHAEKLAKEAAELSHQIGIGEMDGIFGIHMFTVLREQGRLREVEPIMKLIVTDNQGASIWRPGLALIYCNLGLREECLAIFESLASAGFVSAPQDSLWVATLAYLSEVCAFLGDVDRASNLYDLLLPYDGRVVVVGGATACYGAAARYLGMLAVTMSDWRSAERHFQGAIELDAHMEAWPWLAHSQYEYAAMLLKNGVERDRLRAIDLLDDSLCAAKKMGMVYLEKKISDLQTQFKLIEREAGIGCSEIS